MPAGELGRPLPGLAPSGPASVRASSGRSPAPARRPRRPGRGASASPSNRVTMAVTWCLSARPSPVTAALTSLGVWKATGRPAPGREQGDHPAGLGRAHDGAHVVLAEHALHRDDVGPVQGDPPLDLGPHRQQALRRAGRRPGCARRRRRRTGRHDPRRPTRRPRRARTGSAPDRRRAPAPASPSVRRTPNSRSRGGYRWVAGSAAVRTRRDRTSAGAPQTVTRTTTGPSSQPRISRRLRRRTTAGGSADASTVRTRAAVFGACTTRDGGRGRTWRTPAAAEVRQAPRQDVVALGEDRPQRRLDVAVPQLDAGAAAAAACAARAGASTCARVRSSQTSRSARASSSGRTAEYCHSVTHSSRAARRGDVRGELGARHPAGAVVEPVDVGVRDVRDEPTARPASVVFPAPDVPATRIRRGRAGSGSSHASGCTPASSACRTRTPQPSAELVSGLPRTVRAAARSRTPRGSSIRCAAARVRARRMGPAGARVRRSRRRGRQCAAWSQLRP